MTQKQLLIPTQEQPSVQIIDGKATTTSLDVAKFFGKRHGNVIRDIQTLLKQEPEWGVLNFEDTPYIDPQNGQEYLAYIMTRDGFTFLVMGYTGEKARKFKIAYIQAFNAMEATLRNKAQLKLDDYPDKQLGLIAELALQGRAHDAFLYSFRLAIKRPATQI